MDGLSLIVRQQPQRARAIGFSDKDRRPIDPPPIIQLIPSATTADNNASGSNASLDKSRLVCHVTIVDTDSLQDKSIIMNPFIKPSTDNTQKQTEQLTHPAAASSMHGTLVSQCHHLIDDKNEFGYFFVFPDLSCRVTGQFRLKFTVFDLPNHSSSAPKPCIASVVSDVFSVYHPKSFPGMSESTALSKAFAKQGIRIHIRNTL